MIKLRRGRVDLAPWVLFALILIANGRPAGAATLLVDDFEGASNKLGGRSNTYVMAPSRALALQTDKGAKSGAKALMLKYDKKPKGGPYDSGGWCGYYTLLKTGPKYFDATPYQSLTFWVKGGTGEENFVLGLADKHWDEIGDSVKSEEIGKYLPAGKVTTEWQKAAVPLTAFMLEMKELASIAVCFEGSVLPGGEGKGTVYLDDLSLE
ncbi:MAG: hypothetical protein HYZ94_02070 [Candidatus Omnitrophica bacterium]|nr:hypothetical protein [Candidatus Omnitrophota bacterium]